MGSHARLFVCEGPPDLEAALRARLTQLESRWSRFVESSEVCEINRSAGTAVAVSADTMLLLRRALTASRLTRGWFDPTLLNELEAAGYDRPFVELAPSALDSLVITIDRSNGTDQVRIHEWGAACRLIKMNEGESTITIPEGMRFDPGGLGKGLAADLLLAEALDAGATSALVDLGGDIVSGGQQPAGGWPVSIEDPFDLSTTACRIHIPWGAVATSSRAKRRWQSGANEHHHLIDPATGQPSGSDVASATVVAGPCWQAEAFAKAALLAGVDDGLELLSSAGVEGLLIDASGKHHMTETMTAFVMAEAA